MKYSDILKQVLSEAIPLAKAKAYTAYFKPGRYAELFKSFPDHDKNAYRIYLPFTGEVKEPGLIKLDNGLVDFLYGEGYLIIDYVNGLAVKTSEIKDAGYTPTFPKALEGDEEILANKKIRKFRIGSIISGEKELKKLFDNDPQRKTAKLKDKDLLICISRHPVDVAGMSTGRGWRSCMNLFDGDNMEYVLSDVENGTIVAYLIKANDRNIQNPISRLSIKPFVSIENSNETILFPEAQTYGAEVDGFSEAVTEWCNKVNSDKAPSIYKLHCRLYNDGRKEVNHKPEEFVKGKSDEELIEILKDSPDFIKFIKNPSDDLLKAFVEDNSSNIRRIKNPSDELAYFAMENWPQYIDYYNFIITDKMANAFIDQEHKPTARQVGSMAPKLGNDVSEATKERIIKIFPMAIRGLKNPSEKLQDLAVDEDFNTIMYMGNPSEKAQMSAVKQQLAIVNHIKNVSPKVVDYVKKQGFSDFR